MSPAFRPLFGMRSAVFTATVLVAAALLAACSEKSQSLADYIAAICAAHFRDASSAEMPFLTDNVAAMSKMMVDMGITPSGDVDRDFVAMMVPHHQGAMDMALAELRYGAARGVPGTVLLLTLGTGIGTALFVDGKLVPNTEFGHLQVAGREAELRASGRAKVDQQLSWDAWAEQLNLVLREMHALLWPDLIVLCGGITEEPEKFMDKLHCEARLCVGTLRSEAGIVGAALATVI